jgi:hypothetical protein
VLRAELFVTFQVQIALQMVTHGNDVSDLRSSAERTLLDMKRDWKKAFHSETRLTKLPRCRLVNASRAPQRCTDASAQRTAAISVQEGIIEGQTPIAAG